MPKNLKNELCSVSGYLGHTHSLTASLKQKWKKEPCPKDQFWVLGPLVLEAMSLLQALKGYVQEHQQTDRL